jgi:hypothetical protein
MSGTARERRTWFRPLWFLAAAALVVIAANAHLVYVAVSTQPECVAHLKDKGDAPGQFRAAKSAC